MKRPFVTDLLRPAKIIIVEMYTAFVYERLCFDSFKTLNNINNNITIRPTIIITLLGLHACFVRLFIPRWSGDKFDTYLTLTPPFCCRVYINNSAVSSYYEYYPVTICRIRTICFKGEYKHLTDVKSILQVKYFIVTIWVQIGFIRAVLCRIKYR